MHRIHRPSIAAVVACLLVAASARAAEVRTPAASAAPGPHAALIVVDVQNCFVDGGTLPVKDGAAVVPVIERIAPAFATIVETQDWHTPDHASFASAHPGTKPFDTIAMPYGPQVLWPDHCVQGTHDAALVDALHLPTTQLVIRKGFHRDVDSYSAFTEADHRTTTGLAAYLKARGVDTIYVVGLATDFCVAWTAIDGRKAGFRTYVVEDATRAIDLDGSLAAAKASMTKAGVMLIGSSAVAMP